MTSVASGHEEQCTRCGSKLVTCEWDERVNEQQVQYLWRCWNCKSEFVRIYEVDPNFDLTPAEAGHPSWTKTFASAKAQAHKAQHDKEVKEAKERGKAAPPTAGVPKK